MITVCGKSADDFIGRTAEEMLDALGYRTDRIAVELNGGILKKELYASTVLRDGDSLEVVSFVGGG